MYTILILGLMVGVVLGDVSLGYHYDKPSTSYGLPIYQVGGSNSAFSSSSSYPSGNSAFSVVSTYPVSAGNVFSTSNQNYEYSESSSAASTGPTFGTVSHSSGSNLLGSAGNTGLNSHYNTGSSGHYAGATGGSNYNSFNSGTSGSGLNSNYNFGAATTGSGQNSNYNTGPLSSTSGSHYNTGGVVSSTSGLNNYNTGSGVSSGSNSNYNSGSVSSTSGLNSNYNTGSAIFGSGSNYNTASTTQISSGFGNYNSGSSNYNTAGSSNYNNAGNPNYNSGGSLSSSNFIGGVNTGSNAGSNYNYFQGGQSSGISYNPNYQSVPSGPVDISALDKIGSYYQSASANNQFISNHQSSHVQQQEYVNVVQSNQPAQVFKHYYVHAAPEEPEEHKPRAPIVLPPPQKHYKIIFIKAPVQPQPQPQIITVPQQIEEKTIVYVLVKKPEDAKNIVLPKFDQKAPIKPEVFFIKYNNKHDSQSLIDNIVNDYNKGGISATFAGAGASTFTSKSGEGDSSANEGISSSGAAAAVSETDLASTIESVFGNSQSENSLTADSVSSTGAVSSLESLVAVGESASSDTPVSSDTFSAPESASSDESSSDNSSPLELSLNFASDSNVNKIESSSGNSADFNLQNDALTTTESKPSDNRAGDNTGENNGILSIINNFQNPVQSFTSGNFQKPIQSFTQGNYQTFTKPIQTIIPAQITSIPSSISNSYQNFQNVFPDSFGNIEFSSLRPQAIGSTLSGYLPGSASSGSRDVQSDSLLSGSSKFGSDYSSESGSSSSSTFGSSGSASGSSSGYSGLGNKYQFSTISTSQGVPHESYGVPKFRS